LLDISRAKRPACRIARTPAELWDWSR